MYGGTKLNEVKWIKITTDLFEDDKIILLGSMPRGSSYIVIWIQLLCIAGKANRGGYLVYSNGTPYTTSSIAAMMRRKKSLVAEALVLFEKYGMITLEQTDGGFCIKLTNWTKYQNAEALERIREQNRIRKANQRERERLLRKSPDYNL